MKQFKDNAGRTWDVVITVATVRRVKDLLGIDIPGLVNDGMKPLGELMDDLPRFVDLMYVICVEQHCKGGLDVAKSSEEFGAAMGGDAIGAAGDAFLGELVDFFPPRRRPGLTAMIKTAWALTDEVATQAAAKLAVLDLAAIASRLIGSSGTSPGSSASTPTPSPSASSP